MAMDEDTISAKHQGRVIFRQGRQVILSTRGISVACSRPHLQAEKACDSMERDTRVRYGELPGQPLVPILSTMQEDHLGIPRHVVSCRACRCLCCNAIHADPSLSLRSDFHATRRGGIIRLVERPKIAFFAPRKKKKGKKERTCGNLAWVFGWSPGQKATPGGAVITNEAAKGQFFFLTSEFLEFLSFLNR